MCCPVSYYLRFPGFFTFRVVYLYFDVLQRFTYVFFPRGYVGRLEQHLAVFDVGALVDETVHLMFDAVTLVDETVHLMFDAVAPVDEAVHLMFDVVALVDEAVHPMFDAVALVDETVHSMFGVVDKCDGIALFFSFILISIGYQSAESKRRM